MSKLSEQLNRWKKDRVAKRDEKGKVVMQDGKPVTMEYDRLEYASEVAKRLGVTRRTVRKARKGRQAAVERVLGSIGGENAG